MFKGIRLDLNIILFQKLLAAFFLASASVSAYNVGDFLSWMGISYYLLCIIAILKDHRKARIMAWAAVAAHAVLTGYSLREWHYAGIEPCPYCFAAAGLTLCAAAALTRLQTALVPVILMLLVVYAWPGPAKNANGSNLPQIQQQNGTPVGQPAPRPDAAIPPAPAKETGAGTMPEAGDKPEITAAESGAPAKNNQITKPQTTPDTGSPGVKPGTETVPENGVKEKAAQNPPEGAKPKSG